MKKHKNLYEQICSFKNIDGACRKARAGKRSKSEVSLFEFNLEKEMLKIQQELIEESYTPGSYREFYITEPKKRKISAAPYRDRVVHHCLFNVIGPIFEKSFIYDTYANRKMKGTHKAILRAQKYARRYTYVLKCDIKKYFPSIDHRILIDELQKKIGCKKTMRLIEIIINNSNKQEEVYEYFDGDDLFTPFERRRGLPIGNLTSQFFANIYLSRLDRNIKEDFSINGYVRYVDDFLIFSNNKKELAEVKQKTANVLAGFRLSLHDNKSTISRCDDGISFLGFKIFPEYRVILKSNIKRIKKRMDNKLLLKKAGLISLESYNRALAGCLSLASFGKSFKLRNSIMGKYHVIEWGNSKKNGLRGGSWNNNDDNCRAANRNNNTPDNRNNNNGFRAANASFPEINSLRSISE